MGQRTIITAKGHIEQTTIRNQEENACYRSMLQLVALVSLLRTSFTEVMPIIGSASWWMAPLLMAPGLVVYLASILSMRKVKENSFIDWLQNMTGRVARRLTATMFAFLLITDALLSLNVLTSFFSNIIGIAGTPFEIAAVTCIAVMLCLDRNGLPRAISLLRWGMYIAGAVIIISGFDLFKIDSLYPLMGEGSLQANNILLLSGKMSWPFLLLLNEQTTSQKKRGLHSIVVLLASSCSIMLMNLIVPHEIWMHSNTIADALAHLRIWFHQGVRTIAATLVVQALFLLFASEICVGVSQTNSTIDKDIRWLPYAVLLCCAMIHLSDWLKLSLALGWFQACAFIGIAAVLLVVCVCHWRRRKC